MIISTLLFFNFLFAPKAEIPESIYDFRVTALDNSTIDFSQFKGKKILIVNTASMCGNTHQYKELEEVYKKYKNRLVIVGFPANNFMFQEPGSNKSIAEFCERNYGVTFPMAQKISVKGRRMAPIYRWLTEKKHNGFEDSKVTWNFQKYLINEQGQLVAIFNPKTMPDSPEVIAAIEQ